MDNNNQSGKGPANTKNGNKKRWYNNRNKQNSNRPGSSSKNKNSPNQNVGRTTPIEAIFKRYDTLFEQYINSRKKFFESCQKLNDNHKKKTEQIYIEGLRQLRQFEKSLSHWQLAKLQERSSIGKSVTLYQETHNQEPADVKNEVVQERSGPHVTKEQLAAAEVLKKDLEESAGTINDYKAYKGLA